MTAAYAQVSRLLDRSRLLEYNNWAETWRGARRVRWRAERNG